MGFPSMQCFGFQKLSKKKRTLLGYVDLKKKKLVSDHNAEAENLGRYNAMGGGDLTKNNSWSVVF